MLPIWVWIVVFVVAIAVLVKSADWLTDAAEYIGLYFGLPAFLVGVTIVSVGTSLPELASSLVAVFKGSTEIVASNVIGSNIANILLILGITAIVARKLTTDWEVIKVDLPIMVSSVFLLTIAFMNQYFSLTEAIFCLIGYGIYIWYVVAMHKKHKNGMKVSRPRRMGWKNPLILIGSSIALYFGASYTIEAVLQISKHFSIGTDIIAVTAVALGTSLPELTVSVKAALRGKSELAIGNILGSNIANVFLVLGVAGLFGGLTLTPLMYSFGIPVLIAATLLYFFITQDKEVTMWEGAMLVLLYVVFIVKLLNVV